ncbi:MAG: restriction endonuclease subunit S [Burkholderiales bacterium]
MKDRRKTRPLGDLCDILDGQRKPITKRDRTSGDYPYYGATGIVDYVGDFIFDEPLVLVGEDGAKWASGENTAFHVEGKCWVNNHAHVIRPHRTTILDNWLVYFLNHSDLTEFVSGLTVPKLNQGNLREIPIPVPPLVDQQRIVGVLDEAFAGLATAEAHAERNLQNARALFESHLQSVFTQRGTAWVENNMQSLTTKIGSGATPRGGEARYKSEGVALIRSLNVHDMGFRYEKLAFLDDAQANGLSNVVVQKGDVLLNITGASVARCCVVPADVLPARVNQHVSIIRPIAGKLSPEFLHYLLISRPYKHVLLQRGEEGGSTRQAITKAQIQKFKVAHPKTLAEQQEFVARLNVLSTETQRLESLYQQKQAAFAALKKSLLHQAFSGGL